MVRGHQGRRMRDIECTTAARGTQREHGRACPKRSTTGTIPASARHTSHPLIALFAIARLHHMTADPATLAVAQRDMLIDGKRVNVSPGMNITAEIKTGQRGIIEFLLCPVQKVGSERLREW